MAENTETISQQPLATEIRSADYLLIERDDNGDNESVRIGEMVQGAEVATATGTQTVTQALDQRGPVFDNVADMKAATGLTVGIKCRTLGYYTPGDGGGNDYTVVATGTGTADGGSFIDLPGSGLQAKGLFGVKVNVKQFGARGNGSNDDTASIQAAIDAAPVRGSVFIPAGIFIVSAPILIQKSDFTLSGDSNTSTYILRSNPTYGDTITVASATPTTVAISGVVIKDIRIQCNADMESGALIHLINVAASFFTNLTLFNGYRGLWLEGVRTCHFTTTMIQASGYATVARAGSAYVYIGLPQTTALENTELFFNDFNWEGNPRRVEHGVVIHEADGIWFSNGHILGCSNADMHLLSTASSDQLLAVICNNVWFDGYCKRNLQVSGNGALFGLNTFYSCRFTGAEEYSVLVSAGSTIQGLTFHGCEFGVGTLDQAVDIFSGKHVTFNGCRFEQLDTDSSSTFDAFINVRASSTLETLIVNGCTFIGDTKLQNGISLLSGVTEYRITGNDFVNFSLVAGEEITTDQTILEGSLEGNSSDRVYDVVATGGAVYIPALANNANLTGASVSINDFWPAWEGRKINLRADVNSKTLVEGTGKFVSASGGNFTLDVSRATGVTYFRKNDRWQQL